MKLPARIKQAALKDDIVLQPHQKQIEDLVDEDDPLRIMLIHSLGSGKSLSGIAAAERYGKPYTAIAPAALRKNYEGEIAKFTDQKTPADVVSYSALGNKKPIPNTGTVIFDEAHRLRNPGSAQAREAIQLAQKAKQLVLLTGTPIVNRPGDLAVPVSMITGKNVSPEEFESRYVTTRPKYPSTLRWLLRWPSGREMAINHEDELRNLLKGKIDWYDPGKSVVPTTSEDIHVDMGDEQSRLYQAMWDKLPWYIKWKLKNDADLDSDDLKKTLSFLTGPRQVGLSIYPYMKNKDPYRAFKSSTKLNAAMAKLKESLKDDRTKALVFANYIDAGLTPYAAALAKEKIPHGVFHGGLTDQERKQLVEDYNNNKIKVALLGPSGTEGLSFKGTQLVQLLDPHWNPVRPRQAVGRGLRYDSHFGLPDDLQNVKIQRFISRLPLGTVDKMLGRIGFDRSSHGAATDDHLTRLSREKEQFNQKFVELLRQIGSEKKKKDEEIE